MSIVDGDQRGKYKNNDQSTELKQVSQNAGCKETGYPAEYLSCSLDTVREVKNAGGGGNNADS